MFPLCSLGGSDHLTMSVASSKDLLDNFTGELCPPLCSLGNSGHMTVSVTSSKDLVDNFTGELCFHHVALAAQIT